MAKKDSEIGSVVPTVIWGRPERAAKGPAPSRSRAQIAAAAAALADAEGLEEVSMRKVATKLGIGVASLYSYVRSKDELYDLMVDHAEGEDSPPPLTGDWRADVTAVAHRTRDVIRRHPWMATLAPGRPPYGPNSLVWAEHALAALNGTGLSIEDIFSANEILQAFVRGWVIGELAEEQALQRTGLSADEWISALGPYMKTVLGGGEYPMLRRVITEVDAMHDDDRNDRGFTAGLKRLVDDLGHVSKP
jgi:AcrR family transcriptional regulator